MTTETPIHKILEQRKLIGILWGIDDVLEVRPDLTRRKAWKVLQYVDDTKDATIGITWETLEIYAQELFPLPEEESA